jgi:hypothetical protein
MPYTTQGYMTPADLADHEALTDTGRNPECPGHAEDFRIAFCSRAENCPDADADELPDDLSYEEMYGEHP